MNLNTKDFKNYKINGVIKINNVFSSKEISLLKKRINVYIKKKDQNSKEKKLILLIMKLILFIFFVISFSRLFLIKKNF